MILLDTNVISELMKATPQPRVVTWLASQKALDCFIASITEAELRYGIELMPAGQRQQQFQIALAEMLRVDFSGRILPFDSAAANAFATLAAERRRAGKPISQFDAQIAAIARSKGAAVATRNVTDFEGCGITVIDPWK
jgi:predicted nucleic acid-binding protein